MKVPQGILLLLGLVSIAVWALIVIQVFHNPMKDRELRLTDLLSEISTAQAEYKPRTAPPYAEYAQKIAERASLWQPLVTPPQAPPQEPDWKTILGDLKILQVIEGDAGIRVKVRLNAGDARGQWLTKGSAVNGATVREITEKGIIFAIVQNGKEYTHTVPR